MKRAARVCLLVLVILGVAAVAVRRYLTSQHLAARVASALTTALGVPVEVGTVDVGLTASSLRGLTLFEGGHPSAVRPWFTVAELETDLSLWDLVTGETWPGRLTLTGAAVTLRLDKAGRLLTRFPTAQGGPARPFPELHLHQARFTVRQEGRPDLIIAGVDAALVRQGDHLVLEGHFTDPAWGPWDLAGRFDPTSGALNWSGKTTRKIHVTRAMLARLPVIDPSVWQAVQLEGDTPVEVRVRYEPRNKAASYRIALAPTNTRVTIPGIHLDAVRTRGQAVIEDGVVHLHDVRGEAFAGSIGVSADLDFRGPRSHLNFTRITVGRLQVAALPRDWSFPLQLSGLLSGEAQLQVTLGNGQVLTSGQGKGEITRSRLGGRIRIELHSSPEGFQFRNPPPRGQAAPRPHAQTVFLPPWALLGFACTVGMAPPATSGTRLPVVAPRGQSASEDRPKAPPRFWEADFKLDDVDLGQFVRITGLPLPFAVSGRLSVQVRARIPLDNPRDLKAYRASGTATGRDLTLAGFKLGQIHTQVTYADGTLRVQELYARLASGPGPPGPAVLRGTAMMNLVPLGELTANVRIDNLPLSQALQLVPGAEKSAGTLTASITARVPLNRLSAVDAWEVTGHVSAGEVRALGCAFRDTAADIRLHSGTLSLTNAQTMIERATLKGSADLRLEAPFRYHSQLELEGGDLAALQRLPSAFRPPLAIAGMVRATLALQGTLQPLSWQTTGTVSAAGLRLGGVELKLLQFRWEHDGRVLALRDIGGQLYDGGLSGTIILPLQGTAPGAATLSLHNIDVGALAKVVPGSPLRLVGRADGTIRAALSPPGAAGDPGLALQLEMAASRLSIQGIPVEKVEGTADYRRGTVRYHLQGRSLGGRCTLQGQWAGAAPGPTAQVPEGRLYLEDIHLGRLWSTLGLQAALAPLHGAATVDLTFGRQGQDQTAAATGNLVLRRLRWGQTELAGYVGADVSLNRRELRLRNLTGNLGRGGLGGQVAWNLKEPDRSWFQLDLNRTDASRLLAPWPALAARVQGALDARLRGTLGRAWNGTCQVLIARGKVLGVEVVEWHLPVHWSFTPATGSGEVTVPESTAQVALGRAFARASVSWGAGARVEGQLRFVGIDLRSILRAATDSYHLGSGRLTGRLDFAGSGLRTPADLTATLDAALTEAQALDYPVLRQLTPYLRSGLSAATTFHSGNLRATLARGVIRIQQLTLTANLIQLLIAGSASLEGRLNLEVTALTGRLGAEDGAHRLLTRVPLVGPVSAELLSQATNLLRLRLVHLRINGTLANPLIRLDPLFFLSPDALRFFRGSSS